LAVGVVQLVSPLVASIGSFEDTAVGFGLGIGVATWASLIHDLTDAVLGALGVIDIKEYEAELNGPTFWRALLRILCSIYALWLLTFFTKGIRAVHRGRWVTSAAFGLVALIVNQGVSVIFNG
jgi:hypothetical protein